MAIAIEIHPAGQNRAVSTGSADALKALQVEVAVPALLQAIEGVEGDLPRSDLG